MKQFLKFKSIHLFSEIFFASIINSYGLVKILQLIKTFLKCFTSDELLPFISQETTKQAYFFDLTSIPLDILQHAHIDNMYIDESLTQPPLNRPYIKPLTTPDTSSNDSQISSSTLPRTASEMFVPIRHNSRTPPISRTTHQPP